MDNQSNIWEELELAPTEDTACIRAAYKALITRYHPEEYPEKAGRLNLAYRQAMAWAKSRQTDAKIDVFGKAKAAPVSSPMQRTAQKPENAAQAAPQKSTTEFAHIGEFVERVVQQAVEQDLQIGRNMQNEAVAQLQKICRPKHRQNHREWAAFLQNPNTKKAILMQDFALMLADAVEKLRFWTATIRMLRRWLFANLPLDYYPTSFALYANLKIAEQREAKAERVLTRRLVACTVVLTICFATLLITIAAKNSPTNKVAAQISERYGIQATLSEVPYRISYNQLPTYKTDATKDYFQAEAVLSDGVQLTFFITWDKKTKTYTDDFNKQLIRAYADLLHIEVWDNMVSADAVLKIDRPIAQYAGRLHTLIEKLKQTAYIQAGNKLSLAVCPSVLSIGQFSITVAQNTVVDEKELIEQLEQALETADALM